MRIEICREKILSWLPSKIRFGARARCVSKSGPGPDILMQSEDGGHKSSSSKSSSSLFSSFHPQYFYLHMNESETHLNPHQSNSNHAPGIEHLLNIDFLRSSLSTSIIGFWRRELEHNTRVILLLSAATFLLGGLGCC